MSGPDWLREIGVPTTSELELVPVLVPEEMSAPPKLSTLKLILSVLLVAPPHAFMSKTTQKPKNNLIRVNFMFTTGAEFWDWGCDWVHLGRKFHSSTVIINGTFQALLKRNMKLRFIVFGVILNAHRILKPGHKYKYI